MTDERRITINLSRRAKEALDAIMESEGTNITETINKALSVYKLVNESDSVLLNGEKVIFF